MAKIGVVLSGCGFRDGAEIQEAVLTLYFLDKAGAEVVCMAPDINQHHTVNHLTGETVNENRNVLVESARISRGNIKNIKEINVRDLDAVIFPGGFGAALNLSDFGLNGSNSIVNKDVENLIKEVHTLRKTLGFICISPAVCARVLGNSVKVTIGNDEGTANEINKTGANHQNKEVNEICVDIENKVVSTPAYMFDSTPSKVGEGIEKLVNKVLELSN